MTPEAVEAAIDAGDVDGCVALFADATEAQRAAVAKRAAARLRALTARPPRRLPPELEGASLEKVLHRFAPPDPELVSAAQVAVLASASFRMLKRFGAQALPDPEPAYAVLAARRPPWIREWAGLALDQQDRRIGRRLWTAVRRLVREGLCARPTGVGYVQAMIAALPMQVHHAQHTLREVLLDDPGLLEDEVWSLFQVEPTKGALTVLSDTECGNPAFCWKSALIALAQEGKLARRRLLDGSLDVLERDDPEAWSRWFVHLHEALEPSPEERAESAQRYLGLLGSRNPSTVTFAVRALGAWGAASALDPARVLERLASALQARAKGTVKAALALLDQTARRAPALGRRAALLAAEALVHESPDVQSRALDLLEQRGDRTDGELTALLWERSEAVAPSQRARLDAWFARNRPGTGQAHAEAADDLDALQARVAALDHRLSECAGVFCALEIARQGGGPIPAAVRGALDVPRLDPARRIEPVNDLDTLLDLFSAMLESPNSPDDVERLLDGVSRLCDQRPDDFEARTASLRARAESPRPVIGWLLASTLQGLALSWVTGVACAIEHADHYGNLLGLLARRVRAIACRAARRAPQALLSAPTHADGWIDPRELAARRRRAPRASYDLADETLALLRLAPEHRSEALAEARGIEGEFGAALRCALGGAGETVGPTAELWVAAARARAPEQDDADVEQRHPDLGPDAGRAAAYTLLNKKPSRSWNKYYRSLIIKTDPPQPRAYTRSRRLQEELLDLPTVMLHDRQAHNADAVARWAATVWPLDREAFFSTGFESLARLDRGSNAVRLSRPYAELLGSDPLLKPMARLFLAVALSSPNAEDYGLATDALIAAIDDGRVDAPRLGETLRTLLSTPLVKLTRWARRLGDAARVSPLHAQVIAGALQLALVDDLTWAPKDLHVLLERLKELLIELGEPLAESRARQSLGRLTRSGKTGKLIRELLALQESTDRAPQRAAALRALAQRIERAETWARWAAES